VCVYIDQSGAGVGSAGVSSDQGQMCEIKDQKQEPLVFIYLITSTHTGNYISIGCVQELRNLDCTMTDENTTSWEVMDNQVQILITICDNNGETGYIVQTNKTDKELAIPTKSSWGIAELPPHEGLQFKELFFSLDSYPARIYHTHVKKNHQRHSCVH
jgi:hypothetical protein